MAVAFDGPRLLSVTRVVACEVYYVDNTDWMTALFDWLVDPNPVAVPDQMPDYVFRYIGSGGLLLTANNRELRLNAWSQMNDARESKQWQPSGTLVAAGTYTTAEMYTRIDDVLRRGARLLALTTDRLPVAGTDPDSLFHRGCGRAPLWAHYGHQHEGVCLVLDPLAIIEAVDELPPKTTRYRTWGRVNYVDEPIRIDLAGTFHDQSALENLLGTRWAMSGLHMTKNTDWAYETELRIAVAEIGLPADELDTPLMVPLGDALKAVVFGDAHPNPNDVADEVRGALHVEPEFYQCVWTNGAPKLRALP
ncbi:DUF2971 domain-containing protein [Mycolicibacterium peregrinum]|uniref:DUF2971 domain-containing protein n=1 Tax=Mycolicibacterium peregrinum TaxID=43304 RepID=UPI0010567A5F|nr:DUF2971 domain-containing protein [Mycolicibacterium peregrinum]